MTWENIHTLLQVVHLSQSPDLHNIRNAALVVLQAADTDSLHFASQVDTAEPLEDDE